jgi:hypothetical protein
MDNSMSIGRFFDPDACEQALEVLEAKIDEASERGSYDEEFEHLRETIDAIIRRALRPAMH